MQQSRDTIVNVFSSIVPFPLRTLVEVSTFGTVRSSNDEAAWLAKSGLSAARPRGSHSIASSFAPGQHDLRHLLQSSRLVLRVPLLITL